MILKSSHTLIIFTISFKLFKYQDIDNTLPSFTILGYVLRDDSGIFNSVLFPENCFSVLT